MMRHPQGSGVRTRDSVLSTGRFHRRRAVILPVALLVLGLLAVLAANVVFRSNADMAALQASEAALQARLAAEAGIQKAIAVLQGCVDCQGLDSPTGMDAWYDNPDAFAAAVVRTATGLSGGLHGREGPSNKPSIANTPTWRYSVVGNDPAAQADAGVVRFGLTDEASKLNINYATRAQIATLIRQVVRDVSIDVDDLAQAIMYYRNPVREGREDQAEEAYYQSLDPPYQPKHDRFDSLEELLLVRAVTGRVLYGEDYNRNGLLDPEENDGDASFPPDNGDGLLDRGLYPYITIWSTEPNINSRNQPRVNLNNKNASALAKLTFLTDDEKARITLITQQRSIRTPLDLIIGSGENEPAFGKEDLPMLLDEFTTRKESVLHGLVNVNTAPPEVLVAVGFTEQEAHQIVMARGGTSSEQRSTLAWLIDQGVVDPARLAEPRLFNSITARSFQYHVESIGFADHVGTFARIEAIIKMQSPLPVPQVVYWRDLSSLGIGWPVRGQEGSTIAGNFSG